MKSYKTIIIFASLILILIFFLINFEKRQDSKIFFNNCLNEQYLKDKADSYYGIRNFDFYKSMNKIEQALLQNNLLKDTTKQAYFDFINYLNANRIKKLKAALASALTKKESDFLKDIIVAENIKLCLRKKYFSCNEKDKQKINKHFDFYNKFETGNTNYKKLLLSLINVYDDSFYDNKKNRYLILYSVYDIYARDLPKKYPPSLLKDE